MVSFRNDFWLLVGSRCLLGVHVMSLRVFFLSSVIDSLITRSLADFLMVSLLTKNSLSAIVLGVVVCYHSGVFQLGTEMLAPQAGAT